MYEHSVPAVLETALGNLTFNPTSGDGLYLEDLIGTVRTRSRTLDLPQSDGAYIPRAFESGYLLTARGWVRAEAGVSTRRSLIDSLIGKVVSTKRADGRFRFQPSGYSDERMLDDVRLVERPRIAGGYRKSFEFTLQSPYPYTIDKTQTVTSISAGGSATITNDGDAASWPVLQVAAAGSWTIENSTLGLRIEWDGSIASLSYTGYAEWTPFRNTLYQNGDGQNLQGGIVRATSRRWWLAPGDNVITATGAAVDILWNHAWA